MLPSGTVAIHVLKGAAASRESEHCTRSRPCSHCRKKTANSGRSTGRYWESTAYISIVSWCLEDNGIVSWTLVQLSSGRLSARPGLRDLQNICNRQTSACIWANLRHPNYLYSRHRSRNAPYTSCFQCSKNTWQIAAFTHDAFLSVGQASL